MLLVNVSKHRVTIPCKWSFVEKSGAFHTLFMHFSCASPWLYWGILTAQTKNMSFCVITMYRSFFRKTKNRSKGPVLIGLEEIVQRQVGVGEVGNRGELGKGGGR